MDAQESQRQKRKVFQSGCERELCAAASARPFKGSAAESGAPGSGPQEGRRSSAQLTNGPSKNVNKS